MRLTIELDPTEDRALFDRVMAAVMDHPAPVTMESSPTPAPAPETPTSVDTDEPAADRAYGEPSGDRKRRTKEEMAIDNEIDDLAEAKGVKKIPTDVPATEVLEDLRARPDAPAEEISDEDPAEEITEDFDLDETPIPLEDFRAEVIKANKALGGKAIKILSEYGKGITQIPEEKRREVLDRLKAEMADA